MQKEQQEFLKGNSTRLASDLEFDDNGDDIDGDGESLVYDDVDDNGLSDDPCARCVQQLERVRDHS